MTRSQVCKHQVCDYCGECFDMVTQRWWGNKFCKSTCKNAYLRENGGARLAAALAVAVLMLLLLASANAAPSEEQPPAGLSLEFIKEDGTAYIDLSGPIMASTADDLRAALGKYRTSLNRVVLLPLGKKTAADEVGNEPIIDEHQLVAAGDSVRKNLAAQVGPRGARASPMVGILVWRQLHTESN
jgi:hypothetical protein